MESFLGCTIREMMKETDVDVFTVGGTKAGAMFGEAVVFVMEESALQKARVAYDLKCWFEDKKVVRVAMTFATTEEDVLELTDLIE